MARLASPSSIQPIPSTQRDALFFERRSGEREAMHGCVMAAFGDSVDGIVLTRIELVDRGPGGLGVRSPVEIDPGTRLAIYPGIARLSSTGGRVVRCEPDGDEYMIGIVLDYRRQAA